MKRKNKYFKSFSVITIFAVTLLMVINNAFAINSRAIFNSRVSKKMHCCCCCMQHNNQKNNFKKIMMNKEQMKHMNYSKCSCNVSKNKQKPKEHTTYKIFNTQSLENMKLFNVILEKFSYKKSSKMVINFVYYSLKSNPSDSYLLKSHQNFFDPIILLI